MAKDQKRQALEQIRQLGATNVIVRSVKPGQDGGEDSDSSMQQEQSMILEYGLKYRDLERIKATIPTITDVVPIALIQKPAFFEENWIPNARILGTTPDYERVKSFRLRRGRFITAPDDWNTANVAVLGSGAARRLFKFRDPIAQPIMLGEDVYRVIGVLASQSSGTSTPGAVGQQDLNDDIFIPLSCAQRRFGEVQAISSAGSRNFERTELNEITLRVVNAALVSQTAGMVREVLKQTHPNEDDFRLVIPLELLRRAEEEKRIWEYRVGIDRWHLIAGRRYWNYEHHAGKCHRAHQRNRRPTSPRRQALGYHATVFN